MLQTAEEVSKLPLNFIKIHNLHIVRYTELAREYSKKPFHIFTFKEWVDMVCRFLERLNPEFIIERFVMYGLDDRGESIHFTCGFLADWYDQNLKYCPDDGLL